MGTCPCALDITCLLSYLYYYINTKCNDVSKYQSLMCKCLSVHMNIYQQGGGFLQYSRALALPSAISDQHPETAFASSHCPASRTAAGASCAVVSQLSLPILCRNCNRRIVSLPVLKLASIRFVH